MLQDRIEELQQRNDDVVAQADLRRQREAAENYVANSYSPLMNGRLRGKRVAPFTGQPDDDALDAVEQTLQDASVLGGRA